MSVNIGRARYALCIAAVLYGIVGGGAALANHGSPPRPDFVTEHPVPGSAAISVIADGLDGTWVSRANPAGPGFQIVKIANDQSGTQTAFDIGALPAERITVAGGFVWASVTQITSPFDKTGKVLRLDPASTAVTTISVDGNFTINDLVTGPDGKTVWFTETSTGPPIESRLGKIDSAAVNPTAPATPFTGRLLDQIAPGTSPDGNLYLFETIGSGKKIAQVNPVTGIVLNDFTVGGSVAADSLINGPDAVYFLEGLPSGETSITKMTTAGGFTQRGLSSLLVSAITRGPDNAIWFSSPLTGNLGRMATADGQLTVFCIGPSHPTSILGGPGSNTVSFMEVENQVGRVPTNATGAPCPLAPPPSGAGGGGTKKVVKDKTAAKISLSGPRTQRFTKRGTIVVSVKCNEACRTVAQARVSVAGASKVYVSRNAARALAAGKAATLTLKFQKRAVRAIVRSLRRGKRLRANVLIGARDLAGNASRVKRIVKLKR